MSGTIRRLMQLTAVLMLIGLAVACCHHKHKKDDIIKGPGPKIILGETNPDLETDWSLTYEEGYKSRTVEYLEKGLPLWTAGYALRNDMLVMSNPQIKCVQADGTEVPTSEITLELDPKDPKTITIHTEGDTIVYIYDHDAADDANKTRQLPSRSDIPTGWIPKEFGDVFKIYTKDNSCKSVKIEETRQ